jgi:predicted metal-dependent hydrolase
MITTKQQPQVINPYQNEKFLEEAFIRLCEIRKQIQELQKEEEQIKDWAQYYAEEYLLKGEKTGMFEVNGHAVAVSINLRKVYQYPDELTKLEEELKRRKKESELNGTAKLIAVNRYLVFKF